MACGGLGRPGGFNEFIKLMKERRDDLYHPAQSRMATPAADPNARHISPLPAAFRAKRVRRRFPFALLRLLSAT